MQNGKGRGKWVKNKQKLKNAQRSLKGRVACRDPSDAAGVLRGGSAGWV